MLSLIEYDSLVEQWWHKSKAKYQRALAESYILPALKLINQIYVGKALNLVTLSQINNDLRVIRMNWVAAAKEFSCEQLDPFNITAEWVEENRTIQMVVTKALEDLFYGTHDLFVTHWYGDPEEDKWPMPTVERGYLFIRRT